MGGRRVNRDSELSAAARGDVDDAVDGEWPGVSDGICVRIFMVDTRCLQEGLDGAAECVGFEGVTKSREILHKAVNREVGKGCNNGECDKRSSGGS